MTHGERLVARLQGSATVKWVHEDGRPATTDDLIGFLRDGKPNLWAVLR